MPDVTLRREPAFLIDGRWISDGAEGTFAVSNPATGETIAHVPIASDAVVAQAVASARAAFPSFRDLGPHKRASLLMRLATIVDARRDEIAIVLTAEQGKPLDEARGEVAKVARTFEFYAGEAVRVLGQTIPNEEPGFLSMVEKEPIGVAAAGT